MHYTQAKTILSAKNNMNIYRGCSHGCIYCDSRSECYGMKHAFEDIEVKENALELLESALKRKRARCMIGTGAMSDPYMHIEKELKMTRGALELIDRYGFGVGLLTKSDLILRDMDLLTSINEKAKTVVQMTLTTFDEKLCGIVEPNVVGTYRRYQVLKEMQKADIPTVVWITPTLPLINDTEENINGILEYCADAGVKGIITFGSGMTLRSGNREYYYKKLDEHFPGLKEEYIKTYGDSYGIGSKNSALIDRKVRDFCRKRNVLFGPECVFEYLSEFEEKEKQLSLW